MCIGVVIPLFSHFGMNRDIEMDLRSSSQIKSDHSRAPAPLCFRSEILFETPDILSPSSHSSFWLHQLAS